MTTNTVKVNFEHIDSLRFLEDSTEEEIIESLLSLFEIQYQEIAPKILDSINQNKMHEASSLAHKLKSSALQLGMSDVAEDCLFLETECKKMAIHDYSEIIKRLFNRSFHSLENIRVYLKSNKTAVA